MAKRKRLTPAREGHLSDDGLAETKLSPGLRGPISQVSGDAAVSSALDKLAQEMRQARDEGRLIQMIPLDQIEEDYLVRDRVVADDTEMQALIQSLKQRGQQQPVEVAQLGVGRFGLISGWRRLNALRRLLNETGDEARYGQVQAMLRHPDSSADAYLSMVEENEIRVGLSYYERARIAAKAVEQGVYDGEKAALLALFAAASRAKRSKIRSFLPIYHHLDQVLNFAGAIPERLGLRLSKRLEEDTSFSEKLKTALGHASPETAQAEAALIEKMMSPGRQEKRDTQVPRPEITVEMPQKDMIVLRGAGVDATLLKRLTKWLKTSA